MWGVLSPQQVDHNQAAGVTLLQLPGDQVWPSPCPGHLDHRFVESKPNVAKFSGLLNPSLLFVFFCDLRLAISDSSLGTIKLDLIWWCIEKVSLFMWFFVSNINHRKSDSTKMLLDCPRREQWWSILISTGLSLTRSCNPIQSSPRPLGKTNVQIWATCPLLSKWPIFAFYNLHIFLLQ